MIFDLDTDRVKNRPGIKWQRHGPDVMAAWVADMDVEVPDFIIDAIKKRIDTGGLGYDFYDEPIPVIEAFVNRMQAKFNWEISGDDVIRQHDVVQSVQWAINVLTEPGSGIVLQTPAYPPFYKSIEDLGRTMIPNPLRVSDEDGWQLDLDHLSEVASKSNVRTLILCHPHNPCGVVFSESDLQAIYSIAEENDLLVISDEIHSDLVYEPNKHIPAASINDIAKQRTVTVTAATKTFNIAGLRMAFMHTASDEHGPLLKAIPPRLFGGINGLGQIATVAGWEHGDAWISELLSGLDRNRQMLSELIDEHLPGVIYHQPKATYLSWLDCNNLGLGDDPGSVFLEKASVRLNPGLDFGESGAGFVRLNFATSPELLTNTLERMGSIL